MELRRLVRPEASEELNVCPLGDLQWVGSQGSTSKDRVKRHIDRCLARNGYFIGVGDYIDFLSPSNRQKLVSAGFYDTAQDVIADAGERLVESVYEEILKPTTGRWLGMLEGHHFYEAHGRTSDMILAENLKTEFLGTSCFVKVDPIGTVIYAHHGVGGGMLPGAALNKLYHTEAGLRGADLYLMGHCTKMAAAVLARPYPVWTGKDPKLKDREVALVVCGGFSKSNVVGHHHGPIPRGDYAEQRMLTPSPLAAPIIRCDRDGAHPL